MESVIIKGILEDELERNKRMLKTYMDKYEALRKGSIFVRTKGSGQYCYLNYRDGSRVVSEYIGSPDSPEVQDIKEQIEERKRVKQIIKDMKLEQKEIERALKWLLIIWFLENGDRIRQEKQKRWIKHLEIEWRMYYNCITS